jgi:cell wall-associated NlpC family hydrolase
MKGNIHFLLLVVIWVLASCKATQKASNENDDTSVGSTSTTPRVNSKAKYFAKLVTVDRKQLISYARSLKGTRYVWGGTNPNKGLDCSGFVHHVLTKFDVKTPRVSKDFTNEGATIKLSNAKAGDIILFTGSNHSSGIVGHMGFVTGNKNGTVTFIHSSSGNNIGVIESALEGYWQKHYVKTIQIFK